MNRRTIIIGKGNTIIMVAGKEDTEGLFALLEYELAPGFASLPLHIHTAEDAAVYVLEGWLLVRRGEEERLVGAGEFVFLPRGMAHAHSNPAQEPVRFLLLVIPAGFEQCFHDLDTVVETGISFTLERIAALLTRYGARIVENSGAERHTCPDAEMQPSIFDRR